MIDPRTVQNELGGVADQLLKEGDKTSALRIRQLLIALGGDPSAEDWAGANIQQIIDPASIAEGIKSRSAPPWGIGLLEWVRNALVLLPLTLTWLGISQAAEKYQELINQDKTQELHSFLYLWQQGFGHHLANPFILNNLALADFILLSGIFLLTLVTTWRQNMFNAQNERKAELLRTRLSHGLGDAALCLASIHRQNLLKQPTNLQDIARYLYQFGQDFKNTTDQFIREMEAERKNRGNLADFATALDKMSQTMLSAADSIKTTNTNLTTTLQDILVPAREIPRIATAASQAVAGLTAMSGSLNQLVADQNKWRQELQTVLATELGQLTSNQKQATQDMHAMLNTNLTRQISEQNRIGKELHTLVDMSFVQLLAEQKNLGTALTDAANELDKSTTDLSHTLQGFNKTALDQSQFLATMQAMQAEQQRLTGEMAATGAEMKSLLRAVHDSVPELQAMSVNTSKFLNDLHLIPDVLKSELLNPLQHYSSAAAKINTGADKINVGADTLGRATQYFEYVTSKLDKRLGP